MARRTDVFVDPSKLSLKEVIQADGSMRVVVDSVAADGPAGINSGDVVAAVASDEVIGMSQNAVTSLITNATKMTDSGPRVSLGLEDGEGLGSVGRVRRRGRGRGRARGGGRVGESVVRDDTAGLSASELLRRVRQLAREISDARRDRREARRAMRRVVVEQHRLNVESARAQDELEAAEGERLEGMGDAAARELRAKSAAALRLREDLTAGLQNAREAAARARIRHDRSLFARLGAASAADALFMHHAATVESTSPPASHPPLQRAPSKSALLRIEHRKQGLERRRKETTASTEKTSESSASSERDTWWQEQACHALHDLEQLTPLARTASDLASNQHSVSRSATVESWTATMTKWQEGIDSIVEKYPLLQPKTASWTHDVSLYTHDASAARSKCGPAAWKDATPTQPDWMAVRLLLLFHAQSHALLSAALDRAKKSPQSLSGTDEDDDDDDDDEDSDA